MDLLAPCKTCLQCLPFFHDSPPPSPRPLLPPSPPSPPPPSPPAPPPPPAAAAAEEEENPEAQLEEKHCEESVEEAAVLDPSSTDEKSSPSDAALPLQHQDLLPLSEDYTELGSSVYHATIGPEGAIEEEEAAPCIIIAPPVTTHDGYSSPVDPETTKTTVPYELPLYLPFINDIEFSTAGLIPLPSPLTPAPFGSGYPAGQQHPNHPIYHEHHHDHAHPNHHVPPPRPPIEGSQSDHGYHHDNTHHHPPHSHDDDHDAPPHPPLESDHEHHDHAHNHHPHEYDTPPHPPLETSQSADDLELVKKPQCENGGTDEVTITNGSSGLLETSQSEPIVLTDAFDDDDEDGKEPEYTAVRRRDKLKHRLHGLGHQLKQGGQQLKEEGNRHMQNMLNNMKEQAQQLEESGSFFIVPRANNN